MFSKAIKHKGFSVVEVLSQCPTYFGRKNKLGGAPDMMRMFKDRTTPILTLTTESAPEMKARARDAGATGWIVKPFDKDKLVSVIRRVAA